MKHTPEGPSNADERPQELSQEPGQPSEGPEPPEAPQSLREAVTRALSGPKGDREVAEALLREGVLHRVLSLAAVDEDSVQGAMGYSDASMRALVSKARRGRGSFPLPIVEGRWWLNADLSTYRKTRLRYTRSTGSTGNTRTTGNASSTGNAGNASSTGNTGSTGNTRTTGNASSTGIDSIASSTGIAST